jgi:hypothetical protein
MIWYGGGKKKPLITRGMAAETFGIHDWISSVQLVRLIEGEANHIERIFQYPQTGSVG